jgi:dipeptidyl aminopeptidase/acylaminoacyl peptidase
MPDVREVYEMVTKQKSPEPGALERQQNRQVRTARNRKVGAFTVVVLMIVAGAALYTVTRGEGADEGLADRPTPPPSAQRHSFVDLGTGATTPLPSSIGGGFAYVRSPDGARFAYGPWPSPIGDDARLELYVANIDGSGVRRVEGIDALDAIGPSWSPDGTSLVFQLRDDLTEQVGSLMTVDLATGGTRKLFDPVDTSSHHWFMSPSFRPDGERVIFNLPRGAHLSGIGIPRLPDRAQWDLWTASPNQGSLFGSGPIRRNAAHGSYSPDGTTIVFLNRPTIAESTFGARSIWLMDADGTDARPLVEGRSMMWPRWSPDGTRIAYEDADGVYVVDVATGEASKVSDGRAPEWFDDDTLIVGPA